MNPAERDFVVAKEGERASKGKRTEFFYGSTPITPERIENLKKNLKRKRAGKPLPATVLGGSSFETRHFFSNLTHRKPWKCHLPHTSRGHQCHFLRGIFHPFTALTFL